MRREVGSALQALARRQLEACADLAAIDPLIVVDLGRGRRRELIGIGRSNGHVPTVACPWEPYAALVFTPAPA